MGMGIPGKPNITKKNKKKTQLIKEEAAAARGDVRI